MSEEIKEGVQDVGVLAGIDPVDAPPFEAPEGTHWEQRKNAPSTKPSAKPFRWTLIDNATKKMLPSKNPQTALVKNSESGALSKTGKSLDDVSYAAKQTKSRQSFLKTPHLDEPDPESATKEEMILHALYQIILKGIDEPKRAVASVAAIKELLNRTEGLTPSSEEDRRAAAQSQVKIVMVPLPELMHPEPVEEKKSRPVLKPSFIDAEIVSTCPLPVCCPTVE